MDPETQDLYTPDEKAMNAQIDAWNAASQRMAEAQSKWDKMQRAARPSDVMVDKNGNTIKDAAGNIQKSDAGGKQYDLDYKAAQDEFESARAQLAKASTDYADTTTRLAIAADAARARAKTPAEQDALAAQAQNARDRSALLSAQAEMYSAHTQSEIDSATAHAQAAQSNAASHAQRTASQDQLDAQRGAMIGAKLAWLPALNQSTIDLHTQAIATGQAHAKLYAAQAARTEAQADTLIPAQADYYVQRGILTQAQAEQLKIIGPVKAEEIEAKLGVDKARADLIRSQIGKYQLAPGNDRNLPTLTEFRPSTGEVTGVANPSYVNPQGQSIKDTYAAIDQVQQQIASGQMTPEDGDSLIANLKQSLEATSRGVTPEQYQAQQQAQANFGQAGLDKIQSDGESQASTLLGAAKNVRGLGGMSFTPFANAAGMAGGDSIMQKYLDLIGQIKPVTDRSSLLDAIAVHGAANAVLKSGSGDQFAAGASDQSEGGAPGLLSPGMAGTAGDPNIGPTPPTPFAQSDIPEGSSRGAPDEQSQRLLQASMSGRAI